MSAPARVPALAEVAAGPGGAPIPGLWLHSLLEPPAPDALACLSADELARASRFVFERHRRRFLAARCALRQRLAAHLGMAAAALRFVEGSHGKPSVADASSCRFNLSHSEEFALIGIGGVAEIGVDIEALRPVGDLEALARSHFLSEEAAAVLAFEGVDRDAAFLRVWTRKEACLKAAGTGLSVAPDTFAAGIGPGCAQTVIPTTGGPVRVAVLSVDPGVAAQAAVAWVLPG